MTVTLVGDDIELQSDNVPGGTSGPAGGVLAGSYPNPGFAEPMATAADLAGKANGAHQHPLSDLTQSGATNGQVPTWNGSAWAPATPSGGAGTGRYKIVVLGDSLTGTQPNLGPAWPNHLERLIRSAGHQVDVINLAINGWTFYKANTVASFGAKTMAQKAVELAADMYIVALGFNDTIGAAGPVDSRSLAQVTSDATSLFSSLSATGAVVVHAKETPYDTTHGILGSLLNRQVMPIHMQLPSTGILAGCYASEMLGNAVAGGTNTNYSNWNSLTSSIAALGTVAAQVDLPVWKAARLGTVGFDTLHITATGHRLLAAGVLESMKSAGAITASLPGMSSQNYAPMDSMSGIFAAMLQSDGTQWNSKAFDFSAQHTVNNTNGAPDFVPSTWFLPSKGMLVTSELTIVEGKPFFWKLRAATNTQVLSSADGGAWGARGYTDSAGVFVGCGNIAIPPATYVFRYKVGNEVFGPISLTVQADTGTVAGWTPKIISGAGLDAPMVTGAMTRDYVNYSVANSVTNDASRMSITQVGSERRIKALANGKTIWVRFRQTILVNKMAASNTLCLAGTEVLNAAGTTLYHLQLDGRYSPLIDYALVVSGEFVGKFTHDVTFVPWILTSSVGQIDSTAPNGTSTFWSLEIIAEE